MPARPKLLVLDLYKTQFGWELFFRKTKRRVPKHPALPQYRWAVKAASDYANARATTKKPVSVRLYDEQARYRDEMTFPRASDPRRSKG